MGRWIGFFITIALFLGLYLLQAASGPGPRAPGSYGALYLAWFIVLGLFLGLFIGYFHCVGYFAKEPTVYPHQPFEALGWDFFIMAVGIGTATTFAWVTIGVGKEIPGLPDGFAILNYTGGSSGANSLINLGYRVGILPSIAVILASPWLLFWAIVGVVKFYLYFAMRPPELVALQNAPADKPLELDTIMQAIKARAGDEPHELFTTTLPWLARWQQKQKEFWAEKTRERFEQAAATAKAARQTQEDRMIAEALAKTQSPSQRN